MATLEADDFIIYIFLRHASCLKPDRPSCLGPDNSPNKYLPTKGKIMADSDSVRGLSFVKKSDHWQGFVTRYL